MKKVQLIFFFFAALVFVDIFLNGCQKDPIVEPNPYGSVNYHPDSVTLTNPDSNSIVGLHRNIFSTRCALPGCHDGTFEPDYRTVQSTFSTLVYQPVNIFTVDSVHYFKYRVIPYDTTNSFLHERITTHTPNYMPSNGTRLQEGDIQHINAWILGGAKDQFGHLPAMPDNPPQVSYYYALDSAYREIDTNRVGHVSYNPFLVRPNMTVLVAVSVSDDHDSLSNLLVNQLKLSVSEDDFSNPAVYTAVYLAAYRIWLVTFTTAAYPSGTTVYMRYYVNDHTHANPTEFPRTDSPFYYKSYYSFYVQ